KPRRKDKDLLTLVCKPQPAATCPTTTTTTVPCSFSSCACGTPAQPSQLMMTTGAPDLGTKACLSSPSTPCSTDSDCPGGSFDCSSCATMDGTIVGAVKDEAGATLCKLRSGGLYFGGAGTSVPTPAAIPDTAVSLTRVDCCLPDGVSMRLVATTDTDPGSSVERCTSAGVDNGIYAGRPGCLFGPPLPIPNGS